MRGLMRNVAHLKYAAKKTHSVVRSVSWRQENDHDDVMAGIERTLVLKFSSVIWQSEAEWLVVGVEGAVARGQPSSLAVNTEVRIPFGCAVIAGFMRLWSNLRGFIGVTVDDVTDIEYILDVHVDSDDGSSVVATAGE